MVLREIRGRISSAVAKPPGASLKQSLSKGFYAIRYLTFLALDDGLRETAFSWPELHHPAIMLNGSAALDGLRWTNAARLQKDYR